MWRSSPRPATLAFDDGAALARYVRELLPEPFKDAACVWQLSGSSGHPSKLDEIRLHLFFMLDVAVFPQVWKPYFAGLKFVDPSAFDRGKLIFTAAPIIHSGVDPIACRHGLIEGEPCVTVPKALIEQSARIASGADTPKRQEPAPAAAPMPEAAKAFVEIIAKSNILRSHHEAYRNDRARRLAFCAMLGTAFGITDEEALAEAFHNACVGDDDGNGEHDAEQALAWAASPSPSGRNFSPRKLLCDASVALHAANDAETAARAARLAMVFWQLQKLRRDRRGRSMMSNSASNMQAKMLAALNGAVVDPTQFLSTDAGNALLFAAMHKENVRYIEPWRTWAVWNGQRWEIVSDVMLLPLGAASD